MIKKVKGGYKVLSEKTGKNLGGPYKTKEEAAKRLRQVEYFKHNKGRCRSISCAPSRLSWTRGRDAIGAVPNLAEVRFDFASRVCVSGGGLRAS